MTLRATPTHARGHLCLGRRPRAGRNGGSGTEASGRREAGSSAQQDPASKLRVTGLAPVPDAPLLSGSETSDDSGEDSGAVGHPFTRSQFGLVDSLVVDRFRVEKKYEILEQLGDGNFAVVKVCACGFEVLWVVRGRWSCDMVGMFGVPSRVWFIHWASYRASRWCLILGSRASRWCLILGVERLAGV